MPRLDVAELRAAVEDIDLGFSGAELNVFCIDPARFATMRADHKLAASRYALGLARDLIDASFANSTAGWVMIGGVPPTIVEAGTGPEPVSDDEIAAVCHRVGSVVFLATRPDNFL